MKRKLETTSIQSDYKTIVKFQHYYPLAEVNYNVHTLSKILFSLNFSGLFPLDKIHQHGYSLRILLIILYY